MCLSSMSIKFYDEGVTKESERCLQCCFYYRKKSQDSFHGTK